jgi:act minimal PKS acyl carrier protein
MITSTTPLNLNALMDVLQACAGQPTAGFEGRTLDTPLSDLGYDSLALLECAGRLESEHGVHLSDDALSELRTPHDLLTLVNGTAPGA